MKYLLVGLGNIGSEYVATRHNVGFMILDELAARQKVTFELGRLATAAQFSHKGRQIVLIKPVTYMNLSGKALAYWASQLKIPIENTLVIVDDLALPIAKLRMKGSGSSAGHNGLKNIEEILGHNKYPRLKVGIGNDYPKGRQIDYVLGAFTQDQVIELNLKLDKVIDMILSFCTTGIERTMNYLNE